MRNSQQCQFKHRKLFKLYAGDRRTADKPKLGLAKGILQSYVNTTEGIRFGAMIFNSNNEGGHLLKEIKDMTSQNRADLLAAIGGLQGNTNTPLAETLYETGLYFKGAIVILIKMPVATPLSILPCTSLLPKKLCHYHYRWGIHKR